MSRDDSHDSDLEPARDVLPSADAKPVYPETGKRVRYIVGPNGDIITLADLPSPRTTRWVIRRKAEVVLAVVGGLLSLDEACRRYRLTVEEFRAWQRAIERLGLGRTGGHPK